MSLTIKQLIILQIHIVLRCVDRNNIEEVSIAEKFLKRKQEFVQVNANKNDEVCKITISFSINEIFFKFIMEQINFELISKRLFMWTWHLQFDGGDLLSIFNGIVF